MVTIPLIAVDSSAWVALAWREPEAAAIAAIVESSHCITSPVTMLETHMVLRNRGVADPSVFISALMSMPKLDIVAIGGDHFHAARIAFDRYGKGRGHRAGLNFGDCLSYAVAKVAGVPLLFKGEDFRHTDIEPALRS